MTSSLQTSVTVFILRIKVLYKWNSWSCYSTEVKALKWIKRIKGIMTKMKHLNVVLFKSSFLALLHLHCYSAAKILRAIICQFGITFIKWTHFVQKKTNNDNSCSVFLSSQWRAQRLIDDKSSSKRNSKSSRMPLKQEKRRFIILLVVGDISPEDWYLTVL